MDPLTGCAICCVACCGKKISRACSNCAANYFSPGNRDILVPDEKAVLLVPGMVSNALEMRIPRYCRASETWKVVWLNPGELLGHTREKLRSLALDLTEDTLEDGREVWSTAEVEGYEVRLVEGLRGISSLNVQGGVPIYLWHEMIEMLAPEYSTLAFNYDWRRWGDLAYVEEVHRKFVSQVEHAAYVTHLQVTLVCHSMGAQVVLYCLGKQGRDWSRKFIQNVIMCGPAVGGTPSLFPSYSCGPIAGMFDFIPKNIERKLARITSSWACMVAEFPAKVGGIPVFDEDYPFVVTPDKQYLFRDVGQFLRDTADIGKASSRRNCLHHGSALWPGVLEMNECMQAPAVPTHMIYSKGQPTPTQWEYSSSDVTDIPKMTDSQPGDNTVLASVVERLGDAWSKAGLTNVTLHETPGDVNHSSIIQCKFTLELIKELMLEEAEIVQGYEKDDPHTCCDWFRSLCNRIRSEAVEHEDSSEES